MVLNSVKSIIIGTYTALSAFLGTKKIFPSTSSYESTYYSQSITPANAFLATSYTALQTIYLIETKTTATKGRGNQNVSVTYYTYSQQTNTNSYSQAQVVTRNSTIYTTDYYSQSTVGITGSTSFVQKTHFQYTRTAYVYETAKYQTRQITANRITSNAAIQTGGVTSNNSYIFRAANGTIQTYYTAQMAASYSRTTNNSAINSRTSTTNGTFVKVNQQSYKTTIITNV